MLHLQQLQHCRPLAFHPTLPEAPPTSWIGLLGTSCVPYGQAAPTTVGLRSGDCAGHSITASIPTARFLPKYFLHNLEVCFGSLSCCRRKLAPIKRCTQDMAWCCKMERSEEHTSELPSHL